MTIELIDIRHDGPNGWWTRWSGKLGRYARNCRHDENDGNGWRTIKTIIVVSRPLPREICRINTQNRCTCKIDATLIAAIPKTPIKTLFYHHLELSILLPHLFLMFEAADTLLNIKVEVCLSEPVVLDTNIVPANMIYIVV